MTTIEPSKPLQFRSIHRIIPQTPNLEEIKQLRMKNSQKMKQVEKKVECATVMTPRNGKPQQLIGQKGKSFKNLTLLLETPHASEDERALKEVTGLRANLSNRQVQCEQENSRNECMRKSNLDKNGQGMKKKLKPSNIEFKQVKSTKPRLIIEHPINQQLPHQVPKKLQTPTNLSQKAFNLQPYAHNYESQTYQRKQQEYKMSSLANFKSQVNEFDEELDGIEEEIKKRFSSQELLLQRESRKVEEVFERLVALVNEEKARLVEEMALHEKRLKEQFRVSIKEVNSIKKSIRRYMSDIDHHYTDIVQELDLSLFQNIMTTYNTKLQFFNSEALNIFNQRFQDVKYSNNLLQLQRCLQKTFLYNQKDKGDKTLIKNYYSVQPQSSRLCQKQLLGKSHRDKENQSDNHFV